MNKRQTRNRFPQGKQDGSPVRHVETFQMRPTGLGCLIAWACFVMAPAVHADVYRWDNAH